MICLTGDIHHMSLGTGNQAHSDKSEINVARDYLNLLQESRVKVTFLITGKCFEEEWAELAPICAHPLVELGGHTYFAFKPEWWHRAWKKINGSYNGPAWYQRWDAQKTVDIVRARSGHVIRCWRNHMYMHGPYTEHVLASCGIHICSDGVVKSSNGPVFHTSGIYNLPLNVMPDHEHLYHAERTPEWVAWWRRRYNWSDDYGADSYYIEEWTDRVLDELRRHENDGVLSTMLIHPITMYLCDRFKSFMRLIEFISLCQTVHMSEVYDFAAAGTAEGRK